MLLRIIGTFLFLWFFLCSNAQTEEDLDYVSEFTWGVNKNTNSGIIGGITFKLARRSNDKTMTSYGLEFFNVKHPKEFRYYGPSTGTYFVYGKQNRLYSIRMLYGKEQILFKKAQQQGVQISYLAAGGPSIGLISPYYVQRNDGTYTPFTPDLTRTSIIGSGKFLQGLGESEVTVGLNAKSGISFEFGSFKNSVAGLETGVAIEAYPKTIIIIPSLNNRAVFTSIYFTLYWGHRR